ncbi:MAG: hypothetical protein WA102_05665 [Candidatus Methanoperedens sp.]
MNNEENDCPLSSKDWILFLSGEISNLENEYRNLNSIPIVALFFAAMAIIINSSFSTVNANILQNNKANIFYVLYYGMIAFFIIFIYDHIQLRVTKKNAKKNADGLKSIRNDILDGRLKDTNEIRERWRNVMQSNYRELLRFDFLNLRFSISRKE